MAPKRLGNGPSLRTALVAWTIILAIFVAFSGRLTHDKPWWYVPLTISGVMVSWGWIDFEKKLGSVPRTYGPTTPLRRSVGFILLVVGSTALTNLPSGAVGELLFSQRHWGILALFIALAIAILIASHKLCFTKLGPEQSHKG